MPIGFGGALIADSHDHLYILQGFMRGGDAQTLADTGWYRYDIDTGHWHRLASLPVGLGYVQLAVAGTDILVIGGAHDAGQQFQVNSIYRYSTSQDIWVQEQQGAPVTLSGASSCAAGRHQLVIVGGYDIRHLTGLRQSWLVDLATLHWRPLAELPFSGSVMGAAGCDGKGHVFLERGANDLNHPTPDFWELQLPEEVSAAPR